MRLPSCEKAAEVTPSEWPSNIFSILGQTAGLSVWGDNVPLKNGKNCCAILDPVGVNGRADM
jgi:hypothetical protein